MSEDFFSPATPTAWRRTLSIAGPVLRITWYLVSFGAFLGLVVVWSDLPAEARDEIVERATVLVVGVGGIFLVQCAVRAWRMRAVDVPAGVDRFASAQVRRFEVTMPREACRRACEAALASARLESVVTGEDLVTARSRDVWRPAFGLRIELLSCDARTTHVRVSTACRSATVPLLEDRPLRALEQTCRAIRLAEHRANAPGRAAGRSG